MQPLAVISFEIANHVQKMVLTLAMELCTVLEIFIFVTSQNNDEAILNYEWQQTPTFSITYTNTTVTVGGWLKKRRQQIQKTTYSDGELQRDTNQKPDTNYDEW